MSTVGMVPRTCRAKFALLTTSTVDTSESTTSDKRDVFSTVTALALPLRMMVVLVHLEMRREWDRETSISRGVCGES
jgi:hypothetical protein